MTPGVDEQPAESAGKKRGVKNYKRRRTERKLTADCIEDDTPNCAAGGTFSYPVKAPGKALQLQNRPAFQKLVYFLVANPASYVLKITISYHAAESARC